MGSRERRGRENGRRSAEPDRPTQHVAELTIILARRGRDDDPCLDGCAAAQGHDEAADTRVARGKAVIIDEVLPNGDGVAATRERLRDDLAIWLARARARSPSRSWKRREVGGHLCPGRRFWPARVGGHLPRKCRFWRAGVGGHHRRGGRPLPRSPAALADRDPGSLEVAAGRFAAERGLLLVAAHDKPRKSGPTGCVPARAYVVERRAFWASSASRLRYDPPSIERISA